MWPLARGDTEIIWGKPDFLESRTSRSGDVNSRAGRSLEVKPLRVVPCDIRGRPPATLMGSPEIVERETAGNLCVQLYPKDCRIRPVARGDPHILPRDDIEPILLAVARRHIVGREMDPHGCPTSLGVRRP